MYLPKHFEENDLAVLHARIEAWPFGMLVVPRDGDLPEISHIPFVLVRDRGSRGSLMAHVARSNTVWRMFDGQLFAVAVFQGPHAYISPGFYESRNEVPTWNYAVIHVRGRPRVVKEQQAVIAFLRQLSDVHERGSLEPWSIDELDKGWFDELVQHIVVFEMEIIQIEGKFKLSQNRKAADQRGAIRGLEQRGQPADIALARLMTEWYQRNQKDVV